MYYVRKKEKQKELNNTRTDILNDLKNKLNDASGSLEKNANANDDVDTEELKKQLSSKNCALLPVDGKCDNNFVLKDGCCDLYDDLSEVSKDEYEKAVSKLVLTIGVNIMADQILTNILPRVIERGKYIPKLQQLLRRLRLNNTIGKVTARVIGRIAVNVTKMVAVKCAIITMKIISKLGSGPVGWAMFAFDVMTIIMDLGDAGNYDSLISNDKLIKSRNQIIYKLWEFRKKEGMDLPVLFPVSSLFPSEIEEAAKLSSTEFAKLVMKALASDEKYKPLLEYYFIHGLAVDQNEDIPDVPFLTEEEMEEKVKEMVKITRNIYARKIDENTYTNLVLVIKSRTDAEKNESIYDENDIMLLPEFSDEYNIGISITESAAEKWNKGAEKNWFEYNDPFFPKPEPEDYEPELYASYSDTYYTLNERNPGTLSNPNVIKKKAVKKAAFAYPYGKLFTLCEKTRTSAKHKTPINPRDYNVSLDSETGICNYTKDYCSRYGLDHKSFPINNGETFYDCKLSPGQEAVEFILGTTITRGARREWDNRKDALNSGDPDRVAKTAALIFVDPTGVGNIAINQKRENFKKNKEKHGTAAAVLIDMYDATGMVQPFIESMEEKLQGRDKFCETGDECKRFHVKHRGGNFMTWSVRNKDGDVYSKGQAFQREVKANEDHVFYIPKDGYFKVSCNPGQKRNYTYDQVTDPFRVSCFSGIIDTSDRPAAEVWARNTGQVLGQGTAMIGQGIIDGTTAAAGGIETGATYFGKGVVTGANTIAEGATYFGEGVVEGANKIADNLEKLADKETWEPVGDVLNPLKWKLRR